MSKAHLKVHMGGIATAIEFYQSAPTPNLIVLESRSEPRQLLEQLGQLAEYCDPSTKVVVIGHYNDVGLYRELIRSGISEYVVAPISMADVVSVISTIFVDPDADPIGRSIADHIVVNDELSDTIDEMLQIIDRARNRVR